MPTEFDYLPHLKDISESIVEACAESHHAVFGYTTRARRAGIYTALRAFGNFAEIEAEITELTPPLLTASEEARARRITEHAYDCETMVWEAAAAAVQGVGEPTYGPLYEALKAFSNARIARDEYYALRNDLAMVFS